MIAVPVTDVHAWERCNIRNNFNFLFLQLCSNCKCICREVFWSLLRFSKGIDFLLSNETIDILVLLNHTYHPFIFISVPQKLKFTIWWLCFEFSQTFTLERIESAIPQLKKVRYVFIVLKGNPAKLLTKMKSLRCLVSKDTRCLNYPPGKWLWIQILFNHLHFLGRLVKLKSQWSCQSHHQLLLCRNHRKTKARRKQWRKRDQNQPLQLKAQQQLPQALRYVIHTCICK